MQVSGEQTLYLIAMYCLRKKKVRHKLDVFIAKKDDFSYDMTTV